ncbi:MAG: arsenate reductase [Rhodobacteraceae bacterium]|nr:arsenate reductase [Paracoccaceae bacterium]
MIIYGLKNCDVVRKARKALPKARMHDVRDAPLEREKLLGFLASFPDTLVNKRSTAWRNLNEAERASDSIALMQAHPALMKRPLIEAGAKLYLGWSAETERAILADQTPDAP